MNGSMMGEFEKLLILKSPWDVPFLGFYALITRAIHSIFCKGLYVIFGYLMF